MEAIDPKQFSQTYVYVRHVNQPLIGGWDLYKNKSSGEMVYVKEIKFYSEMDRDEYLPRISNCAILSSRKDNGFVKCLGIVNRNSSSDGGYTFSILVIFEYYESTFDKVMLKHINESKTFTIKDILKIMTRLASSLEVLERNQLVHGDVRSGNIAVMQNGTLKLLWAPFMKTTLEVMSEASNTGIAKVMNPSPEIVEAFNHLNFDKRALSGYQNMAQDMLHGRNDIYSLGIFVLKLSNLYSSEPFYIHAATVKVNTKKIEAAILKLYSLNKRLGLCLNNMLVYDPQSRTNFENILEILSSKEEGGDRGLNAGDVALNVNKRMGLGERSENKAIFETDPLGAGDFTLTQSLNEHYDAGDDAFNEYQASMNRKKNPFENDAAYQEQGAFGSPREPQFHQTPFQGSLAANSIRGFANVSREQVPSVPMFATASKANRNPAGMPLLPTSLFEQRGLAEMKTTLITRLENTIFFDESGRLRQGIKIKESIGSKYVGEMFCGRRSGIGIQYYCNGDVCVGNWSSGDMEGECIYFQADGTVFVGSIRANKRDGFGKLLHANGDVYEGEWHSNKKNGQGLYYYYNTDTVYEGSWVLNYKEGWGTYVSRGGEWVEGEWKANRLIMQRNHGFEESFPQIKNLLDFYSDRNGWSEIVEKLQAILNEKGGEMPLSIADSRFQSEKGYQNSQDEEKGSATSLTAKVKTEIRSKDGSRRPSSKPTNY